MPLARATSNVRAEEVKSQRSRPALDQEAEEVRQASRQVEDKPAPTTAEVVDEEPHADEEDAVSASEEKHKESAIARVAQPPVKHERDDSVESLSAEGFEGLEVDGRSFDRIILGNDGQFKIGQEKTKLGGEINVQVVRTRASFIVKRSNDEEETELFYSYQADGNVDTTGIDRSEDLAEWASEGYEPIIQKYMEVQAILLLTDDQLENDSIAQYHTAPVILSIPPSAVPKISGFFVTNKRQKHLSPDQFITNCYAGEELPGKKKGSSYYPWKFRVSKNEELADLV